MSLLIKDTISYRLFQNIKVPDGVEQADYTFFW